MGRIRLGSIWLVVSALATTGVAKAADGEAASARGPPVVVQPTGRPGPELRYDLRVDLPVLVGTYAIWRTLQGLQRELAPHRCRWCDDDLNSVDRGARDALRWSAGRRRLALTLSDISANTLAPVASIGLNAIMASRDDRFSSVPIDLVVIGEAVTIAGIATQVVKYSAGRMRPNARALPADQRPDTGEGNDAYVSFDSGHTSYAFSLAVSAGTVASMRRYPGAPWVWLSGLSVAFTTGYLRIAGDEHYLTDVLASATIASGIGFAVPYLFHRPAAGLPFTPSVQPIKTGMLFGVQGEF